MILLSKSAEYALRAAICLASRHGEPIVTRQLADLTRVPSGYLSKVLQHLSRAEIVQAQRGLHGGFTLARPPDAITILDVLNAIDPVPRIRTCPLELASHGTNLCPLHRQLDNMLASIEQAFADVTLADLLAEQAGDAPLCELEGTPAADAKPRPDSQAANLLKVRRSSA